MAIPEKLIEKAVADYLETRSVHLTAKRVGLGSTTVYRILRSKGIACDGLVSHRQRIRKLPPGEQLLSEYAEGLSVNTLAAKYGCNATTVNQALKKAGAIMRPRGNRERVITEAEAKEIAAQYAELKSQAAVAALRNVSQVRISKALRSVGISCDRLAGENHPSWKGGRGPAPGGYVGVYLPVGDPLRCMADSSGRVMEHRLVMARALGRPLAEYETVHHVDGDRTNNALPNLQLRFGKHGRGVALKCRCCGSSDIVPAELV